MLRWIHTGAPLQWGPAGPPPPFDQGEYPLTTPEEWAAWRDLREEYLSTGAIVRTTPSSDARISRAFLVAKPSEDGKTKFRLVIDLRRINRHLKKVGLKYERLKDFGYLLNKNDFLVGFDIKNAYHHIRMRADEEHFLQFRMGGETFACRALPFGLSLSPFYFTQLMLVVARFLRTPSSCPKAATRFRFGRLAGDDSITKYYTKYTVEDPALLLAYLDDFLASLGDSDRLIEWSRHVRALFGTLGIEFKDRKCQWTPVQCKQHLGILIDTQRCQFLVPHAKAVAIAAKARQIRRAGGIVARDLARFCGSAISLYLAFPMARFFLMSLYALLRGKRSWRDRLRLTPQARLDLQAWSNIDRLAGRSLNPASLPLEGTLATDASLTGWGATYSPHDAEQPLLARGFFDRELIHINIRELQAVNLAVRSFFPRPCSRRMPRRLRLLVDNQVVMHCLRSMTTKSASLLRPLRQLQAICTTRLLLLEPEYIRSEDNILPDRLSRIRTSEDYKLNPRIYREVTGTFGDCTVDRFASARNALCAQYNSQYWDVNTAGVDAFAQNWTGTRSWCNPPWSLLARLVAFLASQPELEAVVLAPDWPSAVWFPQLRRMARAEIFLPRQRNLFLPGDPSMPASLPPPRWNLRAFHVAPRTLRTWPQRPPQTAL